MSRIEFVEFLKAFKSDFDANKSTWGNTTLEDFLEAMITYTEEVQGFYDNMNLNIDADIPTWENFKTILKGASMYE